MRVNIFTYNIPHRKTYDVICLLKARGYSDVFVYGIPMHYKKTYQPLIQHRPSISPSLIKTVQSFCENLGYFYKEIKSYEEVVLENNALVLICGAGIIPEDLIKKYTIINSHPGFIPNVRGLDALKWAIYEQEPIGVTTHLLDEDVDCGYVIDRREVPLNINDTFHEIALRQYEMEVEMLVDAIEKKDHYICYAKPGDFQIHKRMKHSEEKNMFKIFEEYKMKKINGIDA